MKYKQTSKEALKIEIIEKGRREPLWFKDFLKEWRKCSKEESLEIGAHNLEHWICSCLNFKSSCYFLCQHLVKACQKHPRYYTSLNRWPFVVFTEDVNIIENDLSPDQSLLEHDFENYNDIESPESSNDESYLRINALVHFLSIHLQVIKTNHNQLKALEKSLNPAFKYMNDIKLFRGLGQI